MKIAVTGKGGVGKTTVAAGLARLFAREGHPVITIDADPDANLAAARLTNPKAEFIGIAVNTSQMAKDDVEAYLAGLESEFGLPAVDPFAGSVAPLVDRIQ